MEEEEEFNEDLLLEIESLEKSYYEKSSWKCSLCRLDNDSNDSKCSGCQRVRSNSNNGEQQTWTCQKCTLRNPSTSNVCAACHTGNSTSSTISSWDKIMKPRLETTTAAAPSPRELLIPDNEAVQIDQEAAGDWIYPTNYPVRDYQLSIVKEALFRNTLVSLPTGLGKTLIAAVVMYNYYRWFPNGKIIFMAPTKPLVAQQIQACHEIVGIPQADTAELQGSVPPVRRKRIWEEKRVFFCTPQVIRNDIVNEKCSPENIVCLVFDEAHHATKNYAYCMILKALETKTEFFRVLALSATPGAKLNVIQDVITNLKISHIECKSADDPDVRKYTHMRQEEVIKCSLGSIVNQTAVLFRQIMAIPVDKLFERRLVYDTDVDKLSKFAVLQSMQHFSANPPAHFGPGMIAAAQGDFGLLTALLHGYNLLKMHGLGAFRNWIENVYKEWSGGASRAKVALIKSSLFQELMHHVNAASKESTVAQNHPKLMKLREVLVEHFTRHSAAESSTRAIVFTQFRDSVSEIIELFKALEPLIKATRFVGQGSGKNDDSKGQTQKQQQEVVRRFRNGEFNVLVATCIAEEGLDIGEVDLIVSFDALTSPVRMIQRMGRTGRKRVGKVMILVTEGTEENKLKRSVQTANRISRALRENKDRFDFSVSPRMIPEDIQPQMTKRNMEISEWHLSQVGGRTPKSKRSIADPHANLTKSQKVFVSEHYQLSPSTVQPKIIPNLCVRRNLQPTSTHKISHSARCMNLVNILQFIENQDWSVHYDQEYTDRYEPPMRSTKPTIATDRTERNTNREDIEIEILDDSQDAPRINTSPKSSIEEPQQSDNDEASEDLNEEMDFLVIDSEEEEKENKPPPLPVVKTPSAKVPSSRSINQRKNDTNPLRMRLLKRGEEVLQRLDAMLNQDSTCEDAESDTMASPPMKEQPAKPVDLPKIFDSPSLHTLSPTVSKLRPLMVGVPEAPVFSLHAMNFTDDMEVEPLRREIEARSDENDAICIDLSNTSDRDDTISSEDEVEVSVEFKSRAVVEETKTEDTEVCSVCCRGDSYPDDPIVFCDKCNVAAHQHCYGIQDLTDRDWYCESCLSNEESAHCVLCSTRQGIVKKTECNQWVHVQCYAWTPELSFVDPVALRPGSLTLLDPERSNLLCRICSSKEGAPIQCAHKACLTAFHVTCAQHAGLQLQERETEGQVHFVVYCELHTSVNGVEMSPIRASPSDLLTETPKKRNASSFKRLRKRSLQRSAKKKCISKRRPSKHLVKHFIESDVEVDDDSNVSGDEEISWGYDDCDGFIDYASQVPNNNDSFTDMDAVYAQSLMKSPAVNRLNRSRENQEEIVIDSDDEPYDTVTHVHHGYSCDNCNTIPILGTRYSCITCPEYDLCMFCYSIRLELHSETHEFRPFIVPVAEIEIVDPPAVPSRAASAASTRMVKRDEIEILETPVVKQLTEEQKRRIQLNKERAEARRREMKRKPSSEELLPTFSILVSSSGPIVMIKPSNTDLIQHFQHESPNQVSVETEPSLRVDCVLSLRMGVVRLSQREFLSRFVHFEAFRQYIGSFMEAFMYLHLIIESDGSRSIQPHELSSLYLIQGLSLHLSSNIQTTGRIITKLTISEAEAKFGFEKDQWKDPRRLVLQSIPAIHFGTAVGFLTSESFSLAKFFTSQPKELQKRLPWLALAICRRIYVYGVRKK